MLVSRWTTNILFLLLSHRTPLFMTDDPVPEPDGMQTSGLHTAVGLIFVSRLLLTVQEFWHLC